MADDKLGGSDLKASFVFVKHGDPPPTEWMAAHPGWVKFPATFVPRPGGGRPGRATPPAPEPGADPGSIENGTARPVSMGAPMVERPGLRNRGRPPRFPGRFGGEENQPPRADPVAAYLRVTESLAAMGMMEPVVARVGKPAHGAHAAKGAAAAPAVPTAPAPDVNADLRLSAEGHAFVFREETQGHPDRTKHLYRPGGNSGVTLGAGYDFKFRLREQIVEDLIRLGVDRDIAIKLSAAGASKGGKGKPDTPGLSGTAAEKFVKEHVGDVDLTEARQRLLLIFSIAQYEKDVRRKVNVKLSQNEFDALVSFDFSRGPTNLEEIAKLLNRGRRAEAISLLRHFDDSLGAGPASRRQAEADMMLLPDQPDTGTTGSVR